MTINGERRPLHHPLNSQVTLTIQEGDITKISTQAIVNAANQQLEGGAGVCGAIFNAAGWQELQDACDQHSVVENPDIRCPVGHARMTRSFELQSRGITHIIHAVGPDCRIIKKSSEQDRLLAAAYTNALGLADQHGITSIAFPFISAKIYAFPKERAAQVAIQAIRHYVQNHPNTCLTDIRIVLFCDIHAANPHEDYDLWIAQIRGN